MTVKIWSCQVSWPSQLFYHNQKNDRGSLTIPIVFYNEHKNMKTNRLYRILRIIYTTCLWKPDLFTLSFLIPWSSYWKEQWSSHHEQRKKDQPCSNCKWSFLEVSEQPFSECNLNVIVNVIGVFRGFPIFSQIERNRWKIRLFGTYIVSNLSPGDASSPVSRTRNMSNKDTLLLSAQPLL